MSSPPASTVRIDLPPRTVVRFVIIGVSILLAMYLIWLLRRPISWIVIATFLAVALSGPVNWLSRRGLARGLAIAVTYIAMLLVPIGVGAIVVPPVANGANDLADRAPQYARDLQDFVQRNRTLRRLEQDYGLADQLEEQARELPSRLGGAAGTLRDIGLGLVNSIFAAVTILVLSVFMVGGGRGWIRRALTLGPPGREQRLNRMFDRMAAAVGNYVAGVLAQATIAGLTTWLVLTILGVPFAAPLAVVVFFFDLIPLVGATIAAIIVGIVTVFADFPTATIIWTIWAIAYQQIENNVIQPQIQRRALDIHPFAVLVSVLFGSTLFGIPGALLAIPVAASLQIAAHEWWMLRREEREEREARDVLEPPPLPPQTGPG